MIETINWIKNGKINYAEKLHLYHRPQPWQA